jgi:transcriptional regulator with XRE-family HTH domain
VKTARSKHVANLQPYPEFGRSLIAARLAAGIDTQSDLAVRLKCAQQTVSRWEAGTARPRVTQIASLAAVLGIDPKGLLGLAGYAAPTVTVHHAQLFPVDRLDPETFERLVEYLLALRHKDASVRRAGATGHKQDGLDITVTWPDGKVHSFQCKRVDRFGPADALGAIAAHTARADRKYLVLSRIASPQVADALRGYPDWELWDKQYLTRLIRLELSHDDQNRLVDIFFRGQRLGLLGRSEIGPWMSAEEFFAPFKGRHTIFNHDWNLKGRHVEIAKLTNALKQSTPPVILVTGPGGIGKSRILKEALQVSGKTLPGVVVRFLSTSAEITRDGLDALGVQPKLLVIDDAHDRDGLSAIFEYAADPRHKTKLVLASRPYAEARIKREAAVYGIGDIPQIVLAPLTVEQMVGLVQEVLTAFGGAPEWADDIVKATGDCPLVAVMAARVIARDEVPPELAKHDDSLRDTILGKFMRVVAGELGTPADQRFIAGTLEVLALIQPFHIEDPQLVELLKSVKNMDEADIARILRLLAEGGIVYRRGHQFRLMPDLLGDYIIESSCIGPRDRLSPFAERVFDSVAAPQLTHVLVNLGRLDWRKSGGDPSNSRLLNGLWQKLQDIRDEYDPRFEAVRAVAIYQPRQALDFIQRQIDHGRVKHGLSKIIRNIAYNYKCLEEACELLWALGCDDKRDLGPNPDHAIRILSELCGFEEKKPLEYTKLVFDFGLRLIDREGSWEHRYSPFDILRPILSGEGVTTTSDGRHIAMSPFFVNFDVVAPLRKSLINRALSLLTHDSPRVGRHAADFLEQALRAPIGLMGATVAPEVHDQYLAEFAQTLVTLKTIVASKVLQPGVAIGVARSVAWHAHFGSKVTATVAQSVLGALPTDLDFRTRAALADGFGRVFLGRFGAKDWQNKLNGSMAALGTELRASFTDGESLRRYIEKALIDLEEARESENSTHVLVFSLLRQDLNFAQAIVVDAGTRAHSRTRKFASAALNEILRITPTDGRAYAHRFFESAESDLASAAADAFGALRREIEAADVELVGVALSSADPSVAGAAIRAICTWEGMDARAIVDLAKKVNLETAPRLADELGLLFAGTDRRLLDALDRADVDHLLKRMLRIPRLEGYWLEQLLVHISFHFPHELADFFFQRVELAATAETFNQFRPANHGPYAHTKLRIHESPEAAAVLRKTWAWLRKNEHRDFYFQYGAADVFSAMFMSVDDTMVALFDAKLEIASKPELDLIARVLRLANPEFIFTHRAFVVRYFERCRDVGRDVLSDAHGSLFAAAISGVRMGPVGEPATRDLKMVANAKDALKQISRLSPAYRLYDSVRKHAEASIEQTLRDAEALDAR